MTKAPIVVFAYKRTDKLAKCLASLASADGAEESDLFIFADGAKGESDSEDVIKVHEFLDKYQSSGRFKNIHVKKYANNIGLSSNVITGVTDVINIQGRVIVVEDDLTVTRDFLTFINGALEYYENEENIWSVTGFSEPLRALDNYKHDVYYGYRGCSYGWGTWKDRWETVDWNMTHFDEVITDHDHKKRFERGGKDMTRILKDQKAGLIDSWAIRWCLEQSLQDKYTVYPVSSFVENTGIDGTGTHQHISGHVNDNPHKYGEKTVFEKLEPNDSITKEFYEVHSNIAVRALRNLNIKGIKRQIKRLLYDRKR